MIEKYVSQKALACYLDLMAKMGTSFTVQAQLDPEVYGAVIAATDFRLTMVKKKRFMILGQGEILVHAHEKRREHFVVRHLCEQTTLLLTGVQGTPVLRVGNECAAGPGDWHGFRIAGNGCAVIEVLVEHDDPTDIRRRRQDLEPSEGQMVTCTSGLVNSKEGDALAGSTAWHPGD
jgi:hypothetical protein